MDNRNYSVIPYGRARSSRSLRPPSWITRKGDRQLNMHLKREKKRFEVLQLQFSLVYVIYLYIFLNVLGLHCCTWAFSSCSDQEGYSPVAVSRLVIAMASLVTKHGL